MKWETEVAVVLDPEVKHFIKAGPLELSITEEEDDLWQYVSMSWGVFSQETIEECQRTWPRHVIAVLRKALDELEASLSLPTG